METARVDIRKLQLLNDRINQTIDALNQVRLSVHAVQQTAQPAGVPGLGLGHTTPTANPYFTNPYFLQQQTGWGLGVNPFTAYSPFTASLGHTTPEMIDPTYGISNVPGRVGQSFPFAPWGYSPFAPAYAPFGSGVY